MATVDIEPTELSGSPKSRERANLQSTGTRKWLTKWEDRFGTDSWTCPQIRHSRFTDGLPASDVSSYEEQLVCQSVDRDGVGAGRTVDGILLPFDCCVVTAEYAEKQPYNEELEEWPGGCGRVVNGLVNGAWTVIPISQVQYTLTKYFVYNPLNASIVINYVDHVNTEGNWKRQFGRGTLKFNYPSITQFYDTTMGTLLQKIVFNFTYDPYGWNRYPVDGNWVDLPIQLYPYGSFDILTNPALGMTIP